MRNLKQLLFIFAVAATLTLVINWKIPVKGYLPFPGDLLVGRFFPFNTQSWEGYPLGVAYKEFINADVVRQIYPWRDLAIKMLKQREIPWWNPYSFSGTPLLANIQSAPYYPLNFIYWLTQHQIAWIIGVILQPILSMIFMWIFVKELKFSSPAAFLSSISFAFSGYMMIWWQLNTVGHAALWLPLILWGMIKYFKSKKFKFLAVIVFSLSSSLLAGHIQTSIYVLIISLVFFVYLTFKEKVFKKKKLIILPFLGFILSILLALPQLIPSFQLIPLSPRGTQANIEIFKHFVMPFKHLATFVAHDFFGNPATKNYWGEDYGEFMGYFGVVALFFCLTAVIYKRKSPIVKLFSAIALVALLFALPTPLTYLLPKLKIPVLSTSAPSRALFIVQFCGAVLSGVGLDYWLRGKQIIKSVLFLGIPILVLLFLAGTGFVGAGDLSQKTNWQVSLRNLAIPTGIFLVLAASSIRSKLILQIFSNKLIKTGILLAIFLLATFEYLYFVNKFQTYSEFRFFFPKTPIYEYLRKESSKIPFRFFGDYTASVTSNSWIPYGIYGVEGYDSLYLTRYGELLAASENGIIPDTIPRSDANLIKNQDDFRRRRLQDLLGVRFILDKNDNPKSDWEPDPHRFPPDRYQLRWQDGKFKVYENTQSFPRAYLVGDYVLENNPQTIIDTIFNPEFDLQKTMILEEDIQQELVASEGKVEFISYKPNKVELAVTTTTAQLLFLSDAYYPDWVALIDGYETKVFRANYVFRAAVITPGNHRIIFEYQPRLL